MIGDGTSYSEGAAYGTDQSAKLYSPYSVYGEEGSVYDPNDPSYAARSKATLAETKNRLNKLPAYVEKKQWFNVRDELTRYMYETRGATKNLASTPAQKKAATVFFKAIEKTDGAARLKNQAEAAEGAAESVAALDAFLASL